jgi:hypothetical protein
MDDRGQPHPVDTAVGQRQIGGVSGQYARDQAAGTHRRRRLDRDDLHTGEPDAESSRPLTGASAKI